ncbi:MAG: ABC transporter permease [Blastocatellales bacterium]|nr:ABC transporter permease [Blastocatellales bacterium]
MRSLMGSFRQDIRYGIRSLWARPLFTLVAVAALGLGIGANTAIFSVVNALLLQPLPYSQPERLVWIWEINPGSAIENEPISIPNYRDWREQNQSFSELTAWARTQVVLTGAGEPERLAGSVVVSNFFATFGAQPLLGRTFTSEENTPGQNRVVVLSHAFWQRRFGARADIVGQPITLNGVPHTVTGVMPATFKQPEPGIGANPEFWMPLGIDASGDGRRSDFLRVVGRLKDGVSVESARAEMAAIAARLAAEYPGPNAGWTVKVLTLHERFVGDVRRALLILLGMVGCLLLIACANVANLLLARAASRAREIAVRAALGAGRMRLVRQFLTESSVLALLGGAAGLLVAFWGVAALVSLAPPNLPRLDEITVNRSVFLFTLGVSLATGMIFGLAPALHATRIELNEALKESGRSAGLGRRGGRLRSTVIVAEIALTMIMLVVAGLMIRSFVKLQGVDPGFRPERVLSFQLLLPRTKYPEGPQVAAFFAQLRERLAALPGVESAGAIDAVPLSGGGNMLAFSVEGRPAPPPEQVVDAEAYLVMPGYFSTLGIPLARGEEFSSQHAAETPGVTMINETMARRYFPDEDPIGKRITLGSPQRGPWLEIIGVVRDVKHTDLGAEPYPQMYGAHAQQPSRLLSFVIRTKSEPLSIVSAVRSEVRSMDADLPLARITTLEQMFSDSIARPRFNTALLAAFAVVGLLLAAVGIYGVIAYGVTERTHEIGVRIALGAGRGDVMNLVIGQGLKLAVMGVGIGAAGALAVARLMSALLFQTGAADPLTFAGVGLLLLGAAALACYLPARRATRVDPMTALRYE